MHSLLDVHTMLDGDGDGMTITRSQEIPDAYLAELKDARFDSQNRRAGELHRVASIPVALVESWMRQGFDVFREPASKILARLRSESLDAFITTDKRV